ncbi:hypothetical protein D8I24_0152 (plasmid) [Cupriavidus necator H850]|nr:hypothetical protein [Cupriavidus necator]KAI3611163.1 hypothetical protein D8I24_0152 [Cupriavidus necator H850]
MGSSKVLRAIEVSTDTTPYLYCFKVAPAFTQLIGAPLLLN